jgi:hypothetical protein
MRHFETFINSRRLVRWLPDVPFLHDYIDSIELTRISRFLLRPINLFSVFGLNVVVYFKTISLRLFERIERNCFYIPGFLNPSLSSRRFESDTEGSVTTFFSCFLFTALCIFGPIPVKLVTCLGHIMVVCRHC